MQVAQRTQAATSAEVGRTQHALFAQPALSQAATPEEFFQSWFKQVNCELIYQPKWLGEDNYFDAALVDPKLHESLPEGAIARCVDEHSRQILFVGTHWGPVAVFQRYSNDASSLVCQLPEALRRHGMAFTGYLSLDELHILLGDEVNGNLGQ